MKCMLSHNEELVNWIWLSQLTGIGPHAQHKLLNKSHDAAEIYVADKTMLRSSKCLIQKQIEQVLHSRSIETAKRIYDECIRSGVSILTIT